MKHLLIFAFFVTGLFITPLSAHAAEHPAEDKAYLELVDKAMTAADPRHDIDWPKLRRMYQDTSFYSSEGIGEIVWKQITSAGEKIHDEKSTAEIAAYNDLLRKHFAHYRSHLHAITFSQKPEGKFLDTGYQKQAFFGIVDSLLHSGDGKSAETAITVIDTGEEYFILRTVLKVKAGGQRLLQKNGHIYDVLDYTDADGKPGQAFFNIDVMMSKPL